MIVSKHCMDVFLITFMGMRMVMRMVMMIAVMTMGIMIIMTVMTHTIVAVTMMIVKMIATGSTQRKQPLSDTNNNNTLIHF